MTTIYCINNLEKQECDIYEHFFSVPEMKCAYVWVSGDKKCSFFGKFGALSFLVTSVLRFSLLPFTDELDCAICIT